MREEYFFIFHDSSEMNAFVNLASKMGNSYQLWIAGVDGVDFHLGREYTDLSNISLYWGIVGPNVVKLTVRYKVKAASLSAETATSWEYILNRFHLPRQSGAYIIPEGMSLVVVLPQRSRIISYAPAVDEAHRAENMITWEGPITTNDIYVRYEIPKPAGIPSIVEILFSASTNIYISVILLIVAALIFVRREKIKKWVQGYVEGNSEFEE